MNERTATRGAASGATLDIFTVSTGSRRIGVDNAEIERVLSGREARGRTGVDEHTRGRRFRLEELLSGIRADGNADGDDRSSVFVLASTGGPAGLVMFDGVMDVMRIPVGRIMPVPPFARSAQRPLFVWGFYPASGGLITLVTFHYLAQEGAA